MHSKNCEREGLATITARLKLSDEYTDHAQLKLFRSFFVRC